MFILWLACTCVDVWSVLGKSHLICHVQGKLLHACRRLTGAMAMARDMPMRPSGN